MEKRSWKILYSDYSGMQKKAIELLSAEMGKIINRDKGVYRLHVLPCEKLGAKADKNAVMIGKYSDSDVGKFVNGDEIPQDGYLIKAVDNPANTDYKIVIITAHTDRNLFYGAVDFVDDCLMKLAPVSGAGGLRTPCEVFDKKLPDFAYSSAPTVKTRSIFTWGHPINDYRRYIANIARLKINQLIVWNDFLPINAKDIVDCAHEYGIELIWGYAWGWGTDCKDIDLNNLDVLRKEVVEVFLRDYDKSGDGIYFQSFTEMQEDSIGNILVAEAVSDFVNKVSHDLFELRPELHIQFGLHASSVKNHMEYIARVDERVEIVWEDCGSFPYHYLPSVKNEKEFEDAVEFTDEIINLRENGANGFVYKGMITMDWTKFVHQSGPYIMGVSSEELQRSDVEMLKPIWKSFQGEWLNSGKYVYALTKHIVEKTGGNVNINMAGALDGGIWFTEALCAQIMWNCNEDYERILEKVGKRQCVTMA